MSGWLLQLVVAARADEPCRATSLDVSAAVDEAHRALERLDGAAFVAATDRLDTLLPCLAEPVTRHLAAEIHRTKGIRAVSERDPGAVIFFAAARSIEPAYRFPSSLIPEGNPVRTTYGSFDLATGTFASAPPPADGTLSFDGAERTYRPTAWPTVVQHLGGDGSVDFTRYLGPTEPLPDYAVASPTSPAPEPFAPAPIPAPLPPPVVARANPRTPLILAALGGAALTGTTLGLSAASAARFADPDTADDELAGLRSQANALVLVSGFTGAITGGFVVGAVIVGGK